MADVDSTVLIQGTRKQLEMLYLHLKVVQAGISCAAMALRHQSSEQDEDVAHVLDHFVGACLSRQMDRTRELISNLQPFRGRPEDIERMSMQ